MDPDLPDLRDVVRPLTLRPRRAGWRVVADVTAIALLGALAHHAAADLPALPAAGVFVAVAFVAGFGPLHDVLVQGHEATHGLAAHSRRWNAFWLWACHALIGVSGRAYRAFHLDHHRATHTPDDPEAWFYDPRAGRPEGWGYLRLLWATHLMIDRWRTRHTRVEPAQIAVDLAGAALLHASLAALLGPFVWATSVVLPVFTGLAVAVVLRALTEHHGAVPGDPLRATRWTRAHPVLQVLWSHVDHHLEHHLAPQVPAAWLPEVRRHLVGPLAARGMTPDEGLVRSALGLLVDPVHFGSPVQDDPVLDALVHRDLQHHLKVRWFRDILGAPAARRHLWTLYF
ncbi:MAG: fatty acid desaturase, partial [Myxococcales bacterium]|nr:fatty acid desaturase [Myxococcales bacterium]